MRPPGTSSADSLRLESGIVRSECLRVRIFAGFLVLLLIAFTVFRSIPQVFEAVMHPEIAGRLHRHAPVLIISLLAMLIYEGVVYIRLRKHAQNGTMPSQILRLINGAIEVSWVTVLLILTSNVLGLTQTYSGGLTFLYMPVLVLSALNLDIRLSIWMGFWAAAGFYLSAITRLPMEAAVAGMPILTSPHQYGFKAMLLFVSGVAAGLVASTIRWQLIDTLRTVRERDRAVSIFGQHVSPQVAEKLLNQPIEQLGEERDVCVMFLDIRNFSNYAEGKAAPEVVSFLNGLFGGLITCVNEHRGIVNKFLGDGFMAVFGAPADDENLCMHAVSCGHELLAEVDRLVAEGTIPPTRLGIGLHFGQAVTGNVGSEQRKEYTVIGDTVNVAARIEQATKTLACQFLISEAVADQLPPGKVPLEDMGGIDLKGQSKPIRLFKLA